MNLFVSLLLLIFLIAICNITKKASMIIDGRFFEYELPNRTITICPSYSLISIECPQIGSISGHHLWESNLPKYLISIDYIRSYPLRFDSDVNSCQPDISHGCNNYDLRYINALCNGKSHCNDISSYEIRERTLCAFKAVTEIGFHCVPTLNMHEIETKFDICNNNSLINTYGFIYSRNYPSKTVRLSCFTKLYAKQNHKIILYFVNGELNHDQLKIESITSDGISILNISLNGNLTTQKLGASIYEMKITFIPSEIYSYHPTYYLLYFYMVPICSIDNPCLSQPSLLPTIRNILPETTNRMRIQSIGWTQISNIWIIIPIVFAYVFLLIIIVVLTILFRKRRRKQKEILKNLEKTNLSSHYFDTKDISNRVQYPSPYNIQSSYSHTTIHKPLSNSPLSQNNFNPHHHASIPYRIRSTISNENFQDHNTINYQYRSLPKSFSDCHLYKQDNNYYLPRNSRENILPRQVSDNDILLSNKTILNHSNPHIHHLPFQYISNKNLNNIHTNEFKRNINQQSIINDQNDTKKVTVKFYDDDDDYTGNHFDRPCSYETRESQQMSMRINQPQNFNQHQCYHY